jgi:hypothetical protein
MKWLQTMPTSLHFQINPLKEMQKWLECKLLPSGKGNTGNETIPYRYKIVTEPDWTNGNRSIETSRVMAKAN